MKGLQGKKALVTGGGSGIGQAIAIRLGEEGVDVAINYVGRPEGAEETRDAIEHGVNLCMSQLSASGTKPILVAADVSDAGQVDAMFDEVMQQYGGIDILVNNAGIQIAGDTHDLAVADFDRVLAVNLRGAFLVRAAGHPGLADRRPPGKHHQCLQRAPDHPEAAVRRLLGVQGRHAEPDPHARAGVRGAGDPGERRGSGRHGHADQPRLDRRSGQAGGGRVAHPDAPRRGRE